MTLVFAMLLCHQMCLMSGAIGLMNCHVDTNQVGWCDTRLNQTKDLFYELDLVSWLQRLQFCEVNN